MEVAEVKVEAEVIVKCELSVFRKVLQAAINKRVKTMLVKDFYDLLKEGVNEIYGKDED